MQVIKLIFNFAIRHHDYGHLEHGEHQEISQEVPKNVKQRFCRFKVILKIILNP